MAAHSHSTNVIPLPTARRRRVDQPAGLAMVAARQTLPQHPATWEDHGGRKAWEDARFTRSAEMMVAAAIMKVLTEDQKERVRGYIRGIADFSYTPAPHAATALAIVEAIS